MSKTRASRLRSLAPFVPVVLWMGVIFALSAQRHIPKTFGVSIEYTAVAGHLFVYSVLTTLLYGALPPEFGRRRRAVLALVVAVLYGMSDEYHQSFVPGRDASLGDLFVDTLSASVTATTLARWAPNFSLRRLQR